MSPLSVALGSLVRGSFLEVFTSQDQTYCVNLGFYGDYIIDEKVAFSTIEDVEWEFGVTEILRIDLVSCDSRVQLFPRKSLCDVDSDED